MQQENQREEVRDVHFETAIFFRILRSTHALTIQRARKPRNVDQGGLRKMLYLQRNQRAYLLV
jgi:hypothetical protein